jgi:hypothetical protein
MTSQFAFAEAGASLTNVNNSINRTGHSTNITLNIHNQGGLPNTAGNPDVSFAQDKNISAQVQPRKTSE